MKGFELTEQELIELRAAHKEARRSTANAAYKINSVILLGTGWQLVEVAEALLLNDETLRSYIEKYRTGGIQELTSTNHKGSESKLSLDQENQLVDELESNIHLTTLSVIEYVYNTFEVEYTMSGMRDLLHRKGYVYKKPKLVPGKPDIDKQEEFIEQYEAYMLNKPDTTEILFIDAVHPEHNAQAAYGWIKSGQAREMKTNSGRERLNLHGAINAESNEITIIESNTINTESTIELIETVNQKYFMSKEIILIADNARYHYSKAVQKTLLNFPKVRFVFLPSYSPNLNLIERLWGFFKKNVLHNKYHENIQAFRQASIDFFQNIDEHTEKIKSIMGGGFEIRYT